MDRLDWLLRWSAVLLAGLVFMLTLRIGSFASPAWVIVNQGLFTTLAAFLLLPQASGHAGPLVNSAAGAAVLILLALLPAAGIFPAINILMVSLVIFCLSLVLWSLLQLLDSLTRDRQNRRNTLSLVTAGVVAAPVWLGPFVEVHQPGDGTVNGIVWISPLTHFAVAAQYDYLRAEWFYQNSPFGSLAFSYPDMVSIVAVYLILATCLQLVRWWKTHRIPG